MPNHLFVLGWPESAQVAEQEEKRNKIKKVDESRSSKTNKGRMELEVQEPVALYPCRFIFLHPITSLLALFIFAVLSFQRSAYKRNKFSKP